MVKPLNYVYLIYKPLNKKFTGSNGNYDMLGFNSINKISLGIFSLNTYFEGFYQKKIVEGF